jgi:hypothetical protein
MNPVGPRSYVNFQAASAGEDWHEISEYPLYGDTHIIAEISGEDKPLELINLIAFNKPNTVRPIMVLRLWDYCSHMFSDVPDMSQTHEDYYHGGEESDEISALISLCLGIRVRSGGRNRIFGKNGDPKGRPIGWENRNPEYSFSGIYRRPILPNAIGEHNLEGARLIFTLPELATEDATALIRCARMYQEALWMSETALELSWILLCSSVETIAAQWQTSKVSNIDKMKASKPLLVTTLEKYGGHELIEKVADEIAPYMGATKKFLSFITEFLPSAPSERLYPHAQVDWEPNKIKKILNKIYGYRSRALHSGLPFPAPTYDAPITLGAENILSEVPLGLATSMKGAVWVAKDVPMLLNTFEYIARGSILNWWKQSVTDAN